MNDPIDHDLSPVPSRASYERALRAMAESFGRTHGTLGQAAIAYYAELGPAERKQLRVIQVDDAIRYLEAARIVHDLTDPDDAFEVYAHLTEVIGLPDAADLIDRAAQVA